MTALAFLDTETTGLDPTRHEVWEVGLILRGTPESDGEYLWQLPVNAGEADAMGLTVGRFYERRWTDRLDERYGEPLADESKISDAVAGKGVVTGSQSYRQQMLIPTAAMERWADRFARLTWGAHLVGAVPSFDAAFLGPLLRKHGACPGWHYHLVDVEAMAAGAAQVEPPWDSETLSAEVGVDPEKFDRHSALGDARWAMAVYDAVVHAEMVLEGE